MVKLTLVQQISYLLGFSAQNPQCRLIVGNLERFSDSLAKKTNALLLQATLHIFSTRRFACLGNLQRS